MMEKVMKIPPQQRLPQKEGEDTMKPFTEADTNHAIERLKRHKTGGTIGLNHEFVQGFVEMIYSVTKIIETQRKLWITVQLSNSPRHIKVLKVH
ncbi:uncharacterized protein PHALS_05339 [Plasmopara halstedii]|uniref:Uncharacterized protein n=1 Tax=Plasmopara halstedii TaxID=4781 RepID=A0A0P1AAD9_PLAHL|nr:uncharacterized protein PHALS_05339 [Plasmopara halstedii]CEG37559.1 hypothetical protein PHALS_05339 [Plasmopara halstedii]|eukprot:XP_024573928.1 hypothetical protein PHALS_05339 [Plasmopara halstedii]